MANKRTTNSNANISKTESSLFSGQQEKLVAYIDKTTFYNVGRIETAQKILHDITDTLPEILTEAGIAYEPNIYPAPEIDWLLNGNFDSSSEDYGGCIPVFEFLSDDGKYLYTIGTKIDQELIDEKEERINLKTSTFIGRTWQTYEEIMDKSGNWILADNYDNVFSNAMLNEIRNRTSLGAIAIWNFLNLEEMNGESNRTFRARCENEARSSFRFQKLMDQYSRNLTIDTMLDGSMVLAPRNFAEDGFAIGYKNGKYILYQWISGELLEIVGPKEGYYEDHAVIVDETPSFQKVCSFVDKTMAIAGNNDLEEEYPVIPVPLSFDRIILIGSQKSADFITGQVERPSLPQNEMNALRAFLKGYFQADANDEDEENEDSDAGDFEEDSSVGGSNVVGFSSRGKRLAAHRR